MQGRIVEAHMIIYISYCTSFHLFILVLRICFLIHWLYLSLHYDCVKVLATKTLKREAERVYI